MESHYRDILYLTGCAVRDEKAVLRDDMDFDLIIKDSSGQNCSAWVISALISAKNKEIFKEAPRYYKNFLNKAAKYAVRRAHVLSMIELLQNAELEPIMIKGECLSMLYPSPVCRKSLDTDLYFDEYEQYEKAKELLTANGAKVLHPDGGKHVCLEYKTAGKVELHHKIYDDEFKKVYLKDTGAVNEPYEILRTKEGQAIKTLGKNDTLRFLFAHLANHFMFSRTEIRQLCDILIYITKNKSELDEAEFRRFLKATGFSHLFDVLMHIGVKYMGFDPDLLFKAEPVGQLAELYLSDVFNGCVRGVWGRVGDTSVARGTGIMQYTLLKDRQSKAVDKYAAKVLQIIMPPQHLLIRSYAPYENNRVLYPIAWVCNLRDVAKGAVNAHARMNSRKKLFKGLGLLK